MFAVMCFPYQYSDMVHLFTKPVPVISMVAGTVLWARPFFSEFSVYSAVM